MTQSNLPTFSRYTFGTSWLGLRVADFDRDLALAREAMQAGVWFHTSQEYTRGGAFMILRHAFDEARSQTPPLIAKIRCDRAETIRFDVEDACRRLGVERIDVAQLSRDTHDHRRVVDDWLNEGPMWRCCRDLRERGLVGHFIFEVFRGYADDARRAVAHDLFDAVIYYHNPTERQATDAVQAAIDQHGTPVLALRTLGRTLPPQAGRSKLEERGDQDGLAKLDALEQVFAQSGCATWVDFAVRYALSHPNVRTTIGGTSNVDHLREFLTAARRYEPLDDAVLRETQRIAAT